ncbi:MAG: hypothetical protein IKJ79_06210 [Bacteroidaceae bacterium]|nr:hypothetical protein [Bacteroidaceae bacterium]
MKKFLLSILSVVAVAIAGYAEESTVTFDFATLFGTEASVSNIQDLDPLVVDGFTMTFGKGNGSSGVTYNKEGNIRLNGSSTSKTEVDGNTVTIAAPEGKVITGIVLNPGTTYNYFSTLIADQGNITSQGNNVAAYWDGYAQTVVLTACRNKFDPSQATTSRYASVVVSYVSADEAILAVSQYSINGDATNTFKGVNLTFNKEVKYDGLTGGQTVIKNAAGETMGTCFPSATGNTVALEFSETLAAGNYTLVLPANTYKTTDNSIVLPETSINFSLKADKLAGSLNFISSPILAGTSSVKVEWASDEWANNTVTYLVTYDGTEPTIDNYNNASKAKTRNITLSQAKADSILTISVRAMNAVGEFSDVYSQDVYAHYGASLEYYRVATTIEAGNYLMITPTNIAHTFTDASKTYGYLPAVQVANNNGVAQAFNFFEWTFEATDGGYYIKDSKGRYIYMTGNYNSYNISETVPAEGGVWTVTFNEDNTAKILNVLKNKYIQYSEQYKTYGCYADAQGVMPSLAKIATPEVTITPDLDGTTITTNITEVVFYSADGLATGSNINNTSNYMRYNKTYDKYAFTVETVDANTIKFVFEEALPTGDWTFNLKKDALVAGPGTFDMPFPAADKSFKFTIKNPYEIDITPANDANVSALDTITFSNALGLAVDALFEGDAPYLSRKDGETEVKVNLVAANTTATSISFVPEKAIDVEGVYTLVVAAEYFVIGEEEAFSPAISKEYNLVFPLTIVSSTPAEGAEVSSFSELIVEFNKVTVVDEPTSSTKYTLVDPAGNETQLKVQLVDSTKIEITNWGYTTTYYGSKQVRFYTEEPVTAEGAYKVILGNYGWEIYDPVTAVYLPANTTINFTLKDVAPAPLAVVKTTPAEGEEVESFSEIIVEFNKPVYDQDKAASLYSADGTKVATLKKEILDNVGSHASIFGSVPLFTKVRYYAETAVTTDGAYYVQIPADAFTTDDNSEWSTKTVINFTVKAPAPGITATWSIAEGAVLASFSSVDITFTGVESAKAKGSYTNTFFYEKNADGMWQQVENNCTAGYLDVEANGATITYRADPGCYSDDFMSPFSRSGEYRIAIPAGQIVFNGNEASTEEYVLNFTIEGAPGSVEIDAAFTADPANNSSIEKIQEVVVTFTDYTEVTVAEPDFMTGANIPMVYLTDELTGASMPAGYMMFRAGTAANQLVLYVDPAYTGGATAYDVAGSYSISVPKNVVKFGNDINKAFTLNYTVTGAQETRELTVTGSDPANGATVNKLESIVVDWSMAITTPNGDDQIEAYIENVHGINVSTLRLVWAGLAGNQVRYVLNTPITENGIYNLIIPEGDMVDFDTETIKSKEQTLTFTVDALVLDAPAVVESTPADGDKVDAIETFTLVFNKPVVYDDYFEKAYLQDKNGKEIAKVKAVEYKDGDEEEGATTLIFSLDSKVTEPNAYTFVLPAATIVDCYDWMTMMEKDFTINLTIGGADVEDIIVVSSTPSDNSTVSYEFKEIIVEFNTGVAVMYTPNVYDTDNLCQSTTAMEYNDADGNPYPENIVRFTLNTPITKEGTYYVVIEAGSVYDCPGYSIPNSQEYRIKINLENTGINGIEADTELGYVVYDLNGFRVMQTKKASDLDRLENGLYIINGVKVLINK